MNMKKILKKILSSKWLYGIFIALLTVIFTAFINYNFLINTLNHLKNILIFIYGVILSFLNTNIKMWIIIMSLIILRIIFKFLRIIFSDPDWIKYRHDILKEWTWRWGYVKEGERYKIEYMTPYCPKCDCNLLKRQNSARINMFCPKCGVEYDENNIENEEEIKSLIKYNINKKRFFNSGL